MRTSEWAHTPTNFARFLIYEPWREGSFRFLGGFLRENTGQNFKNLILKIYLPLKKRLKMAINWFVSSFQVYFSSELRDFETFDFLTYFGGSEGQILEKIGFFQSSDPPKWVKKSKVSKSLSTSENSTWNDAKNQFIANFSHFPGGDRSLRWTFLILTL